MSTAATTPSGRVSAPQPAVLTVPSGTAWIAGGAMAVVFIAVFWDFFLKQLRFAIDQPSDWGHTLVIPAISGYFIWLAREKLAALTFRPSFSGLLPLLFGLAWYMGATFGPPSVQHHNLRGMGVGITLFGALVMLFGWSAMRYLWFPWAYWVAFGQTISERLLSRVTERMQDWSAVGADVLLNLVGIETDRVGNVLTIYPAGRPPCPLNVAQACSGMRMLVAFMALGVALAYIGLPKWWQRVLLVVLGVPISLFVNVLRVSSLGVLSLADADFTTGDFHAVVGLIWLLPAFLLFLGCMWVIRNLVVDAPTAAAAAAKAPAPQKGGPHAL